MAAADDEDPSVSRVPEAEGEEGGDGGGERSASPTPPPAASAELTDQVTERRLRGEEPGVRDEDTLLSGEEEDNIAAVENAAKRDRVKQTAYVKTKAAGKKLVTADNTDSDLEPERDPKRKRSSGSGSKMTVTPHNGRKKGRGKATEPEIVLDSDEEEEAPATSRHVGVARSTIYTTFRGFVELIRRRAQFLLLNRDGWPIQAGTQNRSLNFKLVLQAARQVLSKADATKFIEAMEAAFKDPS
jgi:hypothetical protein